MDANPMIILFVPFYLALVLHLSRRLDVQRTRRDRIASEAYRLAMEGLNDVERAHSGSASTLPWTESRNLVLAMLQANIGAAVLFMLGFFHEFWWERTHWAVWAALLGMGALFVARAAKRTPLLMDCIASWCRRCIGMCLLWD